MVTCETCPYPHRCQPQEKCLAGKIPGEDVVLPEPVAMNVMTTVGTGTTQPKFKAKKKAKVAKKNG
jgi:hypothetical protein